MIGAGTGNDGESRGGVVGGVGTLVAARLVMVGAAYATYALVGRALSTADFGVYGIVLAVVNVSNAVLGTGMHQAMSQMISRKPDAAAALFKQGLVVSSGVGAVTALAMMAFAPILAQILHDATLTPLLVVVALCPALAALNSLSLGVLNGRGAFTRQGLANAVQALARMGLICAAAFLGYGVSGITHALVLAATLGAVVAHRLVSLPRGVEVELSVAELGRTVLGFVAVAFLMQLLLANDLFLIKRLMPHSAANSHAGLYTAAQSIARVPFFLMIAVSQNAYPRLAHGGHGLPQAAAKRTSSLVLTALVVALAGQAALAVPLNDRLVTFIYPSRYEGATAVLGWLLGGSAALTIAEACLTMLSALFGPGRSILILTGAVLVQAALSVVWIPRYGMVGAAQSSLAATTFAAVAASAWLRLRLGTTLSLRVLAAAALPLLALVLVGRGLAVGEVGPLVTLGVAVAAYAAYVLGIYKICVSTTPRQVS